MTKQEFARRRRHLMDLMGTDSIAVLPNALELTRNRDVHFPFRSDSHFHYLSGFDEPESVLVLVPGREHGEFLLFCRER
ncbi:MAG: aminopeptidase P N-terminal domain-containing protein, partial [Methylophaga sp.]